MKRICFFILPLLALTSCEKVIDLDLNSTDTQLVITGNLSTEKGVVSLTKTVDFDESNIFPAASGASVTITDNTGRIEKLRETTTGLYETSTLTSKIGQTYTLTVLADGKTYTAQSRVPKLVELVSVTVKGEENGQPMGPDGRKYKLDVTYKDPVGESNYYRFVLKINGQPTDDMIVSDDRLTDGDDITRPLRTEQTISKGDVISVELQCIDKDVYTYFNSFGRLMGGPTDSSTPANPITNISGGKLGYFSAYVSQSKSVVVK